MQRSIWVCETNEMSANEGDIGSWSWKCKYHESCSTGAN